jgi:hypothetical protein
LEDWNCQYFLKLPSKLLTDGCSKGSLGFNIDKEFLMTHTARNDLQHNSDQSSHRPAEHNFVTLVLNAAFEQLFAKCYNITPEKKQRETVNVHLLSETRSNQTRITQ